MPGLDRSEYDVAAGDLRRPPGTWPSLSGRAGRLVATNCVIASGGHMAIPHLNGIPARHQKAFGVQPAARLGLSLLDAGIADPSDWNQGEKNAGEVVEKTLRQLAVKPAAQEISTEVDVALSLVNDLE